MTHKPKTLTDGYITNLKPADAGKRYAVNDWGDGQVSSLKVRVTDKGSKSFILWRRYNGSNNNAARSLGTVGEITLAQARVKAREWLKIIARGDDPRTIERRSRESKHEQDAVTFGAVFEVYLEKKVKKLRKAADIEREMRKDLLPPLEHRPLHEITRKDIIRIIENVAERGPYQAHNVLGHAKTFFNWCIVHDKGIEINPCDKIRPGDLIGKKKSRQRVLEDRELKAFWWATGKLGYPFGTLFRLLLLTGQRRSEIAEASRPEINNRILTIPPERFKSDASQMVPLTDEMMALLDAIPHWNAGDFLFSTTGGKTAVNGFSYQKRKLNDMMIGKLGDDFEMKPWVLHDLRRTVRTRLSGLKIKDENGKDTKRPLVQDHVAELVIGHSKKGMQRIYDLEKYIEEMREALSAWNAKLMEIVS